MADSTPRTTFLALLVVFKDILTSAFGYSPERVFVSARPIREDIGIKADNYLVLRGGGAQVDDQWTDSEGRLCTKVTRELIVEPYTRLATDDITTCNDIASVHYLKEDKVVDVLQILEPPGILEPVHFLGIEPQNESKVPDYMISTLKFRVQFLQAVNQSRQ
jgi:hypothetical protein